MALPLRKTLFLKLKKKSPKNVATKLYIAIQKKKSINIIKVK